MPFRDRTEAGRSLANALAAYRHQDTIVLAMPRGGVPVGREIALALQAPLDLIMVRKIGVPFQPELAMGAVAEGEEALVERNDSVIRAARIGPAEFDRVLKMEIRELERRRRTYRGDRPRAAIANKVAIVVDDGLATGASARVALEAVRRSNPARLVLAVPVAAADPLQEIRSYADEVVCLEQHEPFHAIGAYYDDFRQVSDQHVMEVLAETAAPQHRT
ncbi:phosphoribosyltransferase family protein [Aurantimonas sp. A2-1-M11]|uniref:phosphoribosyltransferase n=1 Tax=Aurantimonas sp. A2-1-M11 TaxID=3113712 RepID=UPI002F94D14E